MFRYCAFYGISAPMALLFSKREIDDILGGHPTGPASQLLQNLKFELIKLKEVLSNPLVVALEEDNTSILIKYFISGLNRAFELRDNVSTELETAEPNTTSAETTQLFSLDNELSGVDSSDTLSLESLVSEMEKESWSLPTDLVALGREVKVDYPGKFANYTQVKRYMGRDARKDLSEKDFASFFSQMSNMPMRPSGKVFMNNKTYVLQTDYPDVYEVLTAIYREAFSEMEDSTKIDYIINKITKSIVQSNRMTAKFFGVHYDTLKNIKTIGGCNVAVNSKLVYGPLQTSAIEDKRVILKNLMNDCDILLGNNASGCISVNFKTSLHLNEAQESMSSIADRLLETQTLANAGLSDAKDSLIQLLSYLNAHNRLASVLENSDELIFLVRLLRKLKQLEAGGAVSGWNLTSSITDKDEINDIGIKLATLLNIGGVYIGYIPVFNDTLQITSRAISRTDYTLRPQNTDIPEGEIQYNIQLVRRYLLSLKARLG